MSHMNESWHISIGMSHVTYEWVMAHVNESRHMKKESRPLKDYARLF